MIPPKPGSLRLPSEHATAFWCAAVPTPAAIARCATLVLVRVILYVPVNAATGDP
ncbi:MAG: hypothetical protein AAFQ58_11465 [Pseudomonadota bacterium]